MCCPIIVVGLEALSCLGMAEQGNARGDVQFVDVPILKELGCTAKVRSEADTGYQAVSQHYILPCARTEEEVSAYSQYREDIIRIPMEHVAADCVCVVYHGEEGAAALITFDSHPSSRKPNGTSTCVYEAVCADIALVGTILRCACSEGCGSAVDGDASSRVDLYTVLIVPLAVHDHIVSELYMPCRNVGGPESLVGRALVYDVVKSLGCLIELVCGVIASNECCIG